MARVITFSRTFPAYHPKAGQRTFFVEKFYESLYPDGFDAHFDFFIQELNPKLNESEWELFHSSVIYDKGNAPKHHTIRAGHRFKVGDKFSPRVWSGKPYNSKQIIIAPDLEVKKVWDFEIKNDTRIYINGKPRTVSLPEIAQNDGLTMDDFLEWFKYPKPFDGQIICWNENINY